MARCKADTTAFQNYVILRICVEQIARNNPAKILDTTVQPPFRHSMVFDWFSNLSFIQRTSSEASALLLLRGGGRRGGRCRRRSGGRRRCGGREAVAQPAAQQPARLRLGGGGGVGVGHGRAEDHLQHAGQQQDDECDAHVLCGRRRV